MPRPSVLFLMADDHRHDAMGCAGDRRIATPNLDALAAGGLRYRQAHIMGGHCAAVCIPARATMNTGRDCFSAAASVTDHAGIKTIPAAHITMGEAFATAGYRTFHCGKWHLDRDCLERSFAEGRAMFLGGMHDHWRTPVLDREALDAEPRIEARHSSEQFADAAIDFIERSGDDERPFFLSCCFTSPHDPRTAPLEWHQRYAPESIPLPANYRDQHPFDNGELDIRDERLAPHPRSADGIRQHIADYYAMISHQDHQMGRVLTALKRSGRAADTVVVYTGDHGLAVGQHGLLGKQNCYDHSIRIPLILRGPGLPAGATCDHLAYNFDLFPTLCELCTVPVPASVQGRVIDPGEHGREAIYSVYCDAMASFGDHHHKLIRTYRRADGSGSDRLQLFDREADPWELHDRSADAELRPVVIDLAQRMHQRQRELGDPLAAQDPLAPLGGPTTRRGA